MRRLPCRKYQDPRNRPATDAQLRYIRLLLNEAFVKHVDHGACLDKHHLNLTVATAHSSITRLLAALQGVRS
jgi:hypothetical protein